MATSAESTGVPLRVSIIGLNYAPETTGIAPYTTGLARHLAISGHDVTVITGHPHYPEWRLHPGYERPQPPTDDHGVRLIRVPHPVPRNPGGLSRVWMEIVFAMRAAARLVRRRSDVVVVVSPALLSLLPALLLRPFRGFRTGAVVQDLYGAALAEIGLSGGRLALVTGWLERLLLRRMNGVAVIHQVFRQRLIASGVAEDRIRVIPNWAHVTVAGGADRDQRRRKLGWEPNDFVALHAGNMGAKQGLEGLVDVGRLAEKRGSNVRVVLMGNGSQRDALQTRSAGASRISMMDSLPEGDFEAALAAADCLLLHEKPGVVEMSVPSKLTTYFTAGRPVVAATHERSGAAALIAASQAGVRVTAGDAAGILDAIEKLAADPATAEAMSANGQAYAAEHLTGTASLTSYEAWVRVTAR
ncbi:glycosyltransferase family 4 protein [Blastococcus sp. TF02A-35]|uniref:glycosyltransferase family 4 protein n=1 Tax=Blastococcus sp. TF02A-35 TaxID=2559612 RepID=UPI001073D34A|nr:glycosyltransferase family 4 protein [Blastococcus sp. TF02A_35]TFV53715.1 glycosyltransferase WbuB [Blastococcus sp. TF02A_35]